MVNNDKVWLINDSDEIITGCFGDYYGDKLAIIGLESYDDPIYVPVELLFDSEVAAMRYLLYKVMTEVKELKSKVKNSEVIIENIVIPRVSI